MVVREKNCYYAIALTDFFVFLSCAEANFKETQIDKMKIGQKAWFTVDALGKQKFTGVVKSISPATGSEFSVIKTDNATGNFTKVVQRISVRIDIDGNQSRLNELMPGMSVVSTVDTSS